MRHLAGEGSVIVLKPADKIRAALRDPQALLTLIPNALSVIENSPGNYEGALAFGLGPLQGRYSIVMSVTETTLFVLDITGTSSGRLGGGSATARLSLRELQLGRTEISWRYSGTITGPISLIGNGIQRFAARNFIDRFFRRLACYDR